MAFLEFLSAAARAGIVSPNLGSIVSPGATLHRRHYSAGIGRTRRVCACALFALPVSFPRPAAEGTESGEYPLRYGPSDPERVCKTPSCIRPMDRVGHILAALCLL